MHPDERCEELDEEVIELRRLVLAVMPIVQAATTVAEKSVTTRHAIAEAAQGARLDPTWLPLLEALDSLEVCIRDRAGEMNGLLASISARLARRGTLEPEDSPRGTPQGEPN